MTSESEDEMKLWEFGEVWRSRIAESYYLDYWCRRLKSFFSAASQMISFIARQQSFTRECCDERRYSFSFIYNESHMEIKLGSVRVGSGEASFSPPLPHKHLEGVKYSAKNLDDLFLGCGFGKICAR